MLHHLLVEVPILVEVVQHARDLPILHRGRGLRGVGLGLGKP
jgi:hypothetical protein